MKLKLNELTIKSFLTDHSKVVLGGETTRSFRGCIPQETFLEYTCGIKETDNAAPWCSPEQ